MAELPPPEPSCEVRIDGIYRWKGDREEASKVCTYVPTTWPSSRMRSARLILPRPGCPDGPPPPRGRPSAGRGGRGFTLRKRTRFRGPLWLPCRKGVRFRGPRWLCGAPSARECASPGRGG
ncbi:hypothetical protein SCOCK_500037 [Actinacidiphila cocklensis]|uniref:Uncharacterized protein n=1 Tax=Actinacidiphila cocklensis TaxID=887465 RepID=A0A9W4DW35_9ACTN|nr:hypothetical protein SCOCK_500037 [Actinacidiphila cocklensis]